MNKKIFKIIISLLFFVSACNVEDIISEFGDSVITAKTKVGEVLNTAKNEFTEDAKLSAIYGFNVSTKGEVDLIKPTENAFVYVVQSDSEQSNEFYVPVYKSAPVESPVNFTDMLSLIKNNTAKQIMDVAFSSLSTLHIESTYDDSPAVLSKMLARSDVADFRSANLESKIDMFLIPGKSIDTTGVSNSTDWIVNFYGDTTSLVLWLHPGTSDGTIDVISD